MWYLPSKLTSGQISQSPRILLKFFAIKNLRAFHDCFMTVLCVCVCVCLFVLKTWGFSMLPRLVPNICTQEILLPGLQVCTPTPGSFHDFLMTNQCFYCCITALQIRFPLPREWSVQRIFFSLLFYIVSLSISELIWGK
jgi:hypothetical protein